MLLLCVRRPAWNSYSTAADFAFGRPDRHGLVGESASLWSLRKTIELVARTSEHVLITGESGAGKELVAHAIHAMSPASASPMIARSAATIPETLVDAELFGNTRNYPNAGMAERPGLIGQAHGSTFFLDEIAELSMAAQTHLLRVLDGGQYHRLGEATPRKSQFRLLAATNRPVDALRHDLRARFRLCIHVPSLNERLEDIPLLAFHLLRQIGIKREALADAPLETCTRDALRVMNIELMRKLVHHRYTASVREMEALLWHALCHGDDHETEPTVLPPRGPAISDGPEAGAQRSARDNEHDAFIDPSTVTREQIEASLQECGGIQEKAWRSLRLSSRYVLMRLMAKHGLVAWRVRGSKPE